MRLSTSIVVGSVVLACSPLLAQERSRPPQAGPGTVTLPLTEYDRLVDRAARGGQRPVKPPRPAVVGRAEYRARVDGGIVRGTLRLEGEVLQDGPVMVPLVRGATLFDARSDGRSLPLLAQGNEHAVVLSGPAPFAVVLEWGVPLGAAPGRASFALPAAHAATVSATIDLPGEPVDLKADPALITRRQASSGRTLVDLTLPAGQPSQLSWGVRETAPATPAVEARMLADVKSLWRISEADVQLVSLVEIAMIRGEARDFELRLPSGFEVTSVSGSSLETSASKGNALVLTVRNRAERRHQFLVSAERAHDAGSFRLEAPLLAVAAAQRETGEIAVEAGGTVDVAATGDDGLRRMDVREVHASVRALAEQPLLAAFRYQRRPGETRSLAVDVKRFPDAPVIAAIVDRATATTLVTTEGRMLTEVELQVRNQAQPFVKVMLPPGATMLSVEVAGESARPVQGSDGLRVPLLRPGFRPRGAYAVSFVYLHGGTPFEKRGNARMALASIDVPIGMLAWELFVPERYSVKAVGGNVIPAALLDRATRAASGGPMRGMGQGSGPGPGFGSGLGGAATNGEITGRVADASGSPLPGVTITLVASGVRQTAVTDANGVYLLRNVPSGAVTVTSEMPGFRSVQRRFTFDQRPRLVDFRMDLSAVSETVTVQGEAPVIDTRSSERSARFRPEEPRASSDAPRAGGATSGTQAQQQASQNVLNLQRRVAGVLPVRIDVPRTGSSHLFVRPLVLGDETEVALKYKRR